MRVAFVGKGGVGKSAIAGTFARALARRGESVLALDSDPMPGMAFSLGLERSDAPMPDEAVEERQEGEDGPRYRLRKGLSAEEAIELYAAMAPDGVRFLQFGKHRGQVGPIIRSQFAFRQIIRELPAERWSLVGDLPGGTRQAFAGWGEYAETVFIVVEPTAKSLLTGRRLARMAGLEKAPREVVAIANKVREPEDVELVQRRTGLDVVAAVGWDEALAEAERQGAAPIDMAPDSEAVRAVEFLVEKMCQRQAQDIKERIS
ncbi:MAG TPA: ArsA-related P-loop ATPase [Acidimicrobiales bacterium]|nr:ArsA-related P-loop ATPase [Acidimicrobiales bacterium]